MSILKSGIASAGIATAAAGFSGLLDYKGRRAEGQGAVSSAFNSLMWNVLPGVLFGGGPVLASIAKQLAFGSIPEIPTLMAGIAVASRNQESILRRSALPFSGYGYQPTAGAIQSMNRGLEALGKSRGLSSAHAGLAAQALRR